MNRLSELQIAVIGCGGIAGGYGEEKGGHLLALERMGLQAHTYCDTHLATAQRCLRKYGGQRATDRAEEAIADGRIHAVLVCTRHDSHAPLAIAAARAGKHVFVEKPLTLNETDCEAVVAAGREHGVTIMAGFSKRYTPALRALAKCRGQARLMVAECMEPAWGPDPDYWGLDPVQGGGQVFMSGIHVADALLWLSGSTPVRVFATGGPVTPSSPSCLRQVCAAVDFESGLKAVLVSGDVGDAPLLSKFSLQFYTGTGSAVAHNRLKDLEVTNIPGLDPVHAADERFGDTIRDFLDCVAEDRPSPIPPEEGLKATRLVARMIESIRSQQPVAWKEA